MSDTIETEPDDGPRGLYVTDAEIFRRLGFCSKTGARILRMLQLPSSARRPYPPKDPMFAGKRYWPAVRQWHDEYHRVRADASPLIAPSDQPRWQEFFDASPETLKARRAEIARS